MSYHFISGFPRSGSSLFAAILRQNPACEAQIMSPLGYSVTAFLQSLSSKNEAHLFYSEKQRRDMIEGLFDAYYADVWDKVVFDNNRRWCNNIGLLLEVFPHARIVCCVRPVRHIVDSLERLLRSNALYLSNIIGSEQNTTVYERVKMYMAPGGIVGFAQNAFREAYYGPHRDRLIVLEYSELAQNPEAVMRRVHDELALPQFEYDFNNIKALPGAKEFDITLGTPGLHDLKPRVEYKPSNSILPPELYSSLPEPFWRVKK